MVEQNLAFNKTSSGSVDMLKPAIKKKRTACDNGYFEQWFEDVPDVNKQSKMELVLNQDSEGQLVYVADWNGKGFFPLDSIDDNYFFIGRPMLMRRISTVPSHLIFSARPMVTWIWIFWQRMAMVARLANLILKLRQSCWICTLRTRVN